MKTTFLYTLSDPETGKIRYVGKSDSPFKRFKRHLSGSSRTTHKNGWIKKLRLKGLVPHMDLLDEIPFSDWQFWEQEYIRVFRMIGMDLVNLTDGGDGAYGWVSSPETRAASSAAMKGVPKSAKHRASLSAARKGVPLSMEHRAAMSATRAGKPHTWGAAISAAKKGITTGPRSTESRAKQSAATKGKPWSPARRAAFENSKNV